MESFAVVLVGTQNSGNIGCAARALYNMGLSRLILVAPDCDPQADESQRMARDAWLVVQGAVQVDTLDEALAPFHRAVGTSARRGKRRGEMRPPREFFSELAEIESSGDTALVFGPEDRGLEAGELSRCQDLISIPTSDQFHSINLAQAVLIVCYDLFLSKQKNPIRRIPKTVSLGEQEPMFKDLQEALLEIGYLDPQNPDHLMLDFRKLFAKSELNDREIRILRGLARQIKWTGEKVKKE